MERQKVESSQIESIGHDAETNKLEIEFKGGSVYRYDFVDVDLFESLIHAKSIGKFFGEKIKKDPEKYPFTKINGPVKKEKADGLKESELF